jgi:Tol biopolymer transport system component/plastocyanin
VVCALVMGVVVGLAPASVAAPGNITLASTSDTGAKGNNGSTFPSLSANGARVAFASASTNLDPADTNPDSDIYVKDLRTGDVKLASTSDTGVKGNGDDINLNRELSLSADGTRVAFATRATNLDPADTDTKYDIYVKDLSTGDITLASATPSGVRGNNGSRAPSLSADGMKVAFHSFATNLHPGDPDSHLDLYVKDLSTGAVALASTTDAGVKGNNDSQWASLSDDGMTVAFQSYATNLDPLDPPTDPLNADIYVKDLATGSLTLASTSQSGVKGDGGQPSLSGDGRKVAFVSDHNAFGPSPGGVYVKNLRNGNVMLASTTDSGDPANAGAGDPTLSADGHTVAFVTHSSNLEPGADFDGDTDVYVKNLRTGDVALASSSDTGSKGTGELGDETEHVALSDDGIRIAFNSSETGLDPADPDAFNDVFVKVIATVTVTPASGTPGKQVTITGTGFQPGETAQAKYRTSLSPPPTGASPILCTGVVAADGTFSCPGAIPTGTLAGEPGAHDIVATGLTSLIKVRTTFKLHATVSIGDNFYEPPTVSVAAGTKVVWKNNGFSAHSVTSDTGAFDSSPSCPSSGCMAPGTTFSFKFNAPGSFAYHCRLHPGQRGTVTVT